MADNFKKRFSLMAGVAAYSLLFTPAFAQEVTTETPVAEPADTLPAPEEEEDSGRQEKITITGSLLRRDEFSSAAPIQVITAEAATLEGLIDAGEILQSSSVAAGSVQLNNQFGGFVVEGGTGINSVSLRGLGANRSLVLLNSRRPGPAGVRGQVGSFDLNVIPTSAVQRYEILKDGASSIYGSDAVAGVVNVITRTSVERPELTVQINQPIQGGGESLFIDGAYGLNFDNGNIMLSGQYVKREDLSIGDRDFLSCPQDLAYDPVSGALLDREDRSVTAGTSLSGCSNLYFNTVIDALFGDRYIPDPTAGAITSIDQYRPRTNQSYASGGQAYYEDVLNAPFLGSEDAYNQQELMSFFATSSFDLPGNITWDAEVLYTNRKTEAEGWRQFFPLIATDTYASFGYGYIDPLTGADASYENPFLSLVRPVYAYPSNTSVELDYYSIATTLSGDFGFIPVDYFKDWAWGVDVVTSKSDGSYGGMEILVSKSGDWAYNLPCDTTANPECYGVSSVPTYDPFNIGYLDGSDMQGLIDAIGSYETGNTTYEQTTFKSFVTGDLFKLPAGPVGLAVGTEWRTFELNDTPSVRTQNGDLWGKTSAGVTAGDDDVVEWFAELEVPILKGVPMFEELTLNGSARAFNYASYGTGDVWKAGLNWQVTPTLRFRATKGTSYRAPYLYELYLDNQTSFANQTSIDPCINWGESTNENLRTNCAADGIPSDFNGGLSSATVITGGGKDILNAETSEASTLGMVFTPSFIDLSVAIDYFDIIVEDQVGTLSASGILGACYGAENFPNAFCDLFDRAPATDALDPNRINTVNASFTNIDQQSTRGVDITVRYEKDFDFGDLILDVQATRTLEDVFNFFSTTAASGFDTDDFNGTIGDPEWVGNGTLRVERGDLTYAWSFDYIHSTSNAVYTDEFDTYFGADARYIIDTPKYWTHDLSVQYAGDNWNVVGGVINIFDEEPPIISSGTATRRGNTPLVGGYDLRGRTLFMQLTRYF